LAGVRFRETYFTPTFDKFTGLVCGGVQVHLTDPRGVDAIRTAVAMLVTAKQLYPAVFGWPPDHYVDRLSGSTRLRDLIDAGATVDDVVGSWQADLAGFRTRRDPYLLYR
jgi:uncharacterized protein YbbC (DUF1343 family)